MGVRREATVLITRMISRGSHSKAPSQSSLSSLQFGKTDQDQELLCQVFHEQEAVTCMFGSLGIVSEFRSLANISSLLTPHSVIPHASLSSAVRDCPCENGTMTRSCMKQVKGMNQKKENEGRSKRQRKVTFIPLLGDREYLD